MENPAKLKITILSAVLLLILIAAYLWQAGSWSQRAAPLASPLQKITISTLPIYTPGLLFVAQAKGYFQEHGLEVAIQLFQTGQLSLQQMQAGRVGIAHFSDFVFVDAIFKGAKSLRCLGSIAGADLNHLLALKDRGILQPGDLQGKSVGVTRGTIAEFFLGRFLTFNNLSLKDVKVTYLKPSEMAEALASNRVDAVMVWDPVTYEIKKRLGEKIISWPGHTGQKFYNVLASTEEFIKARPGALEGLFRALAQAETFIKKNPEESLAIIAKEVNLDQAVFKADWRRSDYELSFDQSLAIVMEDEARWMMHNKLTGETRLPDFLNYFDVAPLARADPGAAQIIIPRDERGGAPAQSGTGQER